MISAPPPSPPAYLFLPSAGTTTAPALLQRRDPLINRQYHLRQIGWTPPTGGRGPLVALLDTGVDASHPDLRPVIARSLARSFVGGSALVDPRGHGTHLAGVIAAVGGNGRGGAGIARARIMPIRVADAAGDADIASVVAGIDWAVSRSARVIAIPLGGTTASIAERRAVERAVRSGAVVVAAVGNGGRVGSPPEYPGADPHVLTVAALRVGGGRLPASTQGPQVVVSAPGAAIWSTAPGGRYRARSGTSVAAAVVAGAAARIIAERPSIRADQVIELLRATAHDVGAPGRDDATGAGRIDLARALRTVAPPRDRPEPDDDPWLVRRRPITLPSERARVVVSGSVRRYFDPSDDVRVSLRAGDLLTAHVVGLGGWDPDLVIWRPGAPRFSPGSSYLRDWAAAVALGPGPSETVVFTAPATGVYTVEVRTVDAGGRYRLELER